MASRFEKFSERARRVLTVAQEEARHLNHSFIGTEHILLALVREEEGVASKVLVNLGVSLGKVRSAVEFIIGHGEKSGRYVQRSAAVHSPRLADGSAGSRRASGRGLLPASCPAADPRPRSGILRRSPGTH